MDMEAVIDIETIKPQQPKIYPFLFASELWERFGFYVIQGLLVLYMTQFYGFADSKSYAICGIFTGMVYIAPFIGGFLAEKVLGFKTAIIWGGLFLVAGYTLLAMQNTSLLFFSALAIIVLGNGLLKPNIASLLSTQYTNNDTRRDSAFSLFHISINIGAALSGFSGYIQHAFGWKVTFILPGIGMLIASSSFIYGMKYIKNTQNIPPASRKLKSQLLMYCLLAALGVCLLLQMSSLTYWLLPAAFTILLVFLALQTMQQPPEYRGRMLILSILILSSIVFWMLFLQIFTSATLYIDRLVNKNLFGIHLTTTIFYAMQSIYILVLTPLLAFSWNVLGNNKKNLTPISKFIISLSFMGLGFLMLAASTLFPNSAGLVNSLWVFSAYFLITIAELLLAPIGLSAVTLLAPPRLISLMIGTWFVATAFGGLLAGKLATFASIPNLSITLNEKLAIYQSAFFNYASLAFFIAIVLLFVNLGSKRINQP